MLAIRGDLGGQRGLALDSYASVVFKAMGLKAIRFTCGQLVSNQAAIEKW